MINELGHLLSQQLINLQKRKNAQSTSGLGLSNQQGQAATNTRLGGFGNNVFGATSQSPPVYGGSPGIGAMCTIHKTGTGEFVITGDSDLLKAYFEISPELWLRCAALKGTKNGKTKK